MVVLPALDCRQFVLYEVSISGYVVGIALICIIMSILLPVPVPDRQFEINDCYGNKEHVVSIDWNLFLLHELDNVRLQLHF